MRNRWLGCCGSRLPACGAGGSARPANGSAIRSAGAGETSSILRKPSTEATSPRAMPKSSGLWAGRRQDVCAGAAERRRARCHNRSGAQRWCANGWARHRSRQGQVHAGCPGVARQRKAGVEARLRPVGLRWRGVPIPRMSARTLPIAAGARRRHDLPSRGREGCGDARGLGSRRFLQPGRQRKRPSLLPMGSPFPWPAHCHPPRQRHSGPEPRSNCGRASAPGGCLATGRGTARPAGEGRRHGLEGGGRHSRCTTSGALA